MRETMFPKQERELRVNSLPEVVSFFLDETSIGPLYILNTTAHVADQTIGFQQETHEYTHQTAITCIINIINL